MPQAVQDQVTIDASLDHVWEVLSDLEAITAWHPGITDVEVHGEPGQGATRVCTFADGSQLSEAISDWQPGTGLTYEITGDLPIQGAIAQWTLQEASQGTTVTYRMPYTALTDDLDAQDAVRDELQEALSLLLQSLKHYVETGEPLEVAGAEVDA